MILFGARFPNLKWCSVLFLIAFYLIIELWQFISSLLMITLALAFILYPCYLL